MKLFQKLTLITAVLGLIIPLLGVVTYVFINSLTGIPVLALFLGNVILIAILIIVINVAAIFLAFYVRNTKLVGIILICCGALLLVTVQLWGLPGLALFPVSGILALKEQTTHNRRKYTLKCLKCGKELKMVSSDFAKDHLIDEPTHLEYSITVEINSAGVDSKIT